MGGCCCSSRKYQLHGTPVYYYCPPALEEHESLTSHDSERSTGLLIDLDLDTSIPDTYRSPPTPIPFDVVLGCPQSADLESVGQTCNGSSFGKGGCLNLKEPDCKPEDGTFLASPRKIGFEFQRSKSFNVSTTEEEDVCPTCLEDYDVENPRITTKCNHQFHLSCILEWMERSDTCPICNQEMDFEAL